jgi:hypothetical protein
MSGFPTIVENGVAVFVGEDKRLSLKREDKKMQSLNYSKPHSLA